MSRARRVVRPYQGVTGFQAVLDSFCLEVGDRLLPGGGLVTTSAADFITQPVRLRLAENEADHRRMLDALSAACSRSGLQPTELELLVVIRTPRLKLSEIVFRAGLDELAHQNRRIDLTGRDRPRPLRTPTGGCTVHTYVSLRETRERVALSPWRKGTWIARQEHKIKTNLDAIGFTPLELTDEIREQEGLPPGTLRFAIVEDPLADGSGPESILLYIEPEILHELAANPKTEAAKGLQRELFMTAVSAAVAESSRRLTAGPQRTVDDIENSVAMRLIQLVTGDASMNDRHNLHQHFFRMLRDQPAKFIAHAENRVPDYRVSILSALRGGMK